MFKKMLIVSSCVLVAAVAVGTPNAQATAQASASAGINWDSFSYTVAPGMSLSWSNQGAYVYGSPDNWASGPSKTSDNWSDSIAVTASHPNGSATASAGGSGLQAQSTASGNNGSYSDAQRWGNFSVTGSGMVTFTIANYSQALDLQAKSSGESAYGTSAVWLTLSNRSFGVDTSASRSFNGYVGDGWWNRGDGTFSRNSSVRPVSPLVVTMDFTEGEQGYFAAQAYASTTTSTPTPVPAAVWLLGSGLAGLVGLKRRKETANV